MKRVMIMTLGFLSTMIAQATPFQKIMSLNVGIHPAPRAVIKASTPVVDETYTDFTGEWAGHCHVKEGDVDDEVTADRFHLENNGHWIKMISEDGIAEEYEIGKDLSEHRDDKNGFAVTHSTFNWVNDSTLLFSLTWINNYKYPDFERSVDGVLARVTWTLPQHDTLIMRSEVHHFENDEDTIHSIGTCEYTRQ